MRAANAEGAGLILEGPLSASEGAEIFTVEIEEAGREPEPEAESSHHGHEHGAASLAVTASSDAGSSELERCADALTIECYAHANVVLRIDRGEPPQLRRIEAAIAALESDE